jgi:hypothetical protein
MPQTELNPNVYRSHTHYENLKRWKAIFAEVLNVYVQTKHLPAVVAITYDDELPPNRKLGADGIHYIADVELAVAKATGDDTGLRELWLRLVAGEELSSAATARLAVKAGRIFDIRGLAPQLYFRSIRRGRKDRRFVPSGEAA